MKLISFEGIEGVGKSTQINLLKIFLESRNLSVEVHREPGSTVVGEKIREILLDTSLVLSNESELLLMFAARAELVNVQILNCESDFLLLDRFYDASLAYQGYGRNISIDFINSLIAYVKCPLPNKSFLLDINVEESFKRKQFDEKDRIESSSLDFFNNVRKGYLKIADENQERICIIDATKDIETIHKQVVSELDNELWN